MRTRDGIKKGNPRCQISRSEGGDHFHSRCFFAVLEVKGRLGIGCVLAVIATNGHQGLNLQFLWHHGHGAVLCADEGTDTDSGAVGFGYGLAIEDATYKGAGEGVAGAYGVGNGDLRSLLERYCTGGEDVGTVGAAGEHEHVEVVLAQDEPALVLDVETRIAEHTTDEHEFLVVDL